VAVKGEAKGGFMPTVEGAAADPSGSCRAPLLPAVAVAFVLAFSPAAEGRTRCSYAEPPTNLLTVTTDRDGLAEIRRTGQEIRVRESGKPRQACSGGVPTVLNTDTIMVRVNGLVSFAELQLAGGPFAPGATPEPEGAPEIEVEFRGSNPFGTVVGTPAADEFQWGHGGVHAGLNLNPGSADDRDVDVTLGGNVLVGFLVADGAAGHDRIIPTAGLPLLGEAWAKGGRGDDLLVAPRNGAILEGGPGDDVLSGSRGPDELHGDAGSDLVVGAQGGDLIRGGRGRDLLLGGRGADFIFRERDSQRDRIRCGPGRDRVKADRFDRLRGCEGDRRR